MLRSQLQPSPSRSLTALPSQPFPLLLIRNSQPPLPLSPLSRLPSILRHELAEAGVLSEAEVVTPIAKDIMHGEAAGGIARRARLRGAVGKSESVAALGIEVFLAAVGESIGRASGALGGELPVGAVAAGAGLEDLVGGAGVGWGQGVGAACC